MGKRRKIAQVGYDYSEGAARVYAPSLRGTGSTVAEGKRRAIEPEVLVEPPTDDVLSDDLDEGGAPVSDVSPSNAGPMFYCDAMGQVRSPLDYREELPGLYPRQPSFEEDRWSYVEAPHPPPSTKNSLDSLRRTTSEVLSPSQPPLGRTDSSASFLISGSSSSSGSGAMYSPSLAPNYPQPPPPTGAPTPTASYYIHSAAASSTFTLAPTASSSHLMPQQPLTSVSASSLLAASTSYASAVPSSHRLLVPAPSFSALAPPDALPFDHPSDALSITLPLSQQQLSSQSQPSTSQRSSGKYSSQGSSQQPLALLLRPDLAPSANAPSPLPQPSPTPPFHAFPPSSTESLAARLGLAPAGGTRRAGTGKGRALADPEDSQSQSGSVKEGSAGGGGSRRTSRGSVGRGRRRSGSGGRGERSSSSDEDDEVSSEQHLSNGNLRRSTSAAPPHPPPGSSSPSSSRSPRRDHPSFSSFDHASHPPCPSPDSSMPLFTFSQTTDDADREMEGLAKTESCPSSQPAGAGGDDADEEDEEGQYSQLSHASQTNLGALDGAWT